EFLVSPKFPAATINNFLSGLTSIGVSLGQTGGILRIDVTTGAREGVSDTTHGAGERFIFPLSIAMESSGDFVVVDAFRDFSRSAPDFRNMGAVIRVDSRSGNRTLVSGNDRGNGPLFGFPIGLTVDPVSGVLFVADPGL